MKQFSEAFWFMIAMMIFALLLMLIATCNTAHAAERTPIQPPERPRLVDRSMIYMFAGTAADFGTTRWALADPRFREGNPMLGNSVGSQVAIMGGLTGINVLLAKSLKDSGHPKAAKVLCYISGSIHFGAAAYNVQLKWRN